MINYEVFISELKTVRIDFNTMGNYYECFSRFHLKSGSKLSYMYPIYEDTTHMYENMIYNNRKKIGISNGEQYFD